MIHNENGRMNEGKKKAFQCIFHSPLILSEHMRQISQTRTSLWKVKGALLCNIMNLRVLVCSFVQFASAFVCFLVLI
jgi:hypothetical protein